MIVAIVPLVVAILGALMYALSANPKVSELGRIAYAVGLLVAVAALAGHVVRL